MQIKITKIGHLAQKALINQTQLQFFGQTSKGIFLKTNQKILFLNREPFTGPLTLNYEPLPTPFPKIPSQTIFTLKNTHILCSRPAIQFTLATAQTIHPPIIPIQSTKIQRIQNAHIAIQTLQQSASHTLLPLTQSNHLSTHPQPHTAITPQQYTNIQSALQQKNHSQLLQALIICLGRGNGLTPSGDDFICGIILAETIINNTNFSPAFKNQLIHTAQQTTTLISANLIEAAFQKSADQRILTALKQICADVLSNTDAIQNLTTWGNSSGLDTLTGIILVIQA